MPDWTANGIPGVGKKPELANRFKGDLIVIGSAEGVWDDMEKAISIAKAPQFMAINLMFCAFKQSILDKKIRIHHWATVHPEFFAIRGLYTGRTTTTHSCTQAKDVDALWKIRNNGTSGLFGIRVGLAMGFERVILCGMPMDNRPHLYDYPSTKLTWPEDKAVEMAWEEAIKDDFKGRVISMSGRTKEWLEKAVSCG